MFHKKEENDNVIQRQLDDVNLANRFVLTIVVVKYSCCTHRETFYQMIVV